MFYLCMPVSKIVIYKNQMNEDSLGAPPEGIHLFA